MNKKPEKEALSKRQMLREQRLKQERQRRLMVVVGVGVLVLIVAGILLLQINQRNQADAAPGEVKMVTSRARPQANVNSMGDPNAPVKMVEYSDFQCPYCKRFADETAGLIEENYIKTGKVYFTHRSMGNWISNNTGLGKTESQDAAMAAYCAGDQQKFWQYQDMLYANWNGEDEGAFVESRLMAFAQAIQLDMTQFKSCFSSKKHLPTVTKDMQDGRAMGIQGTPSFVINGKLIEGAQPYDKFKAEIEAALAAKP